MEEKTDEITAKETYSSLLTGSKLDNKKTLKPHLAHSKSASELNNPLGFGTNATKNDYIKPDM
jgi:hypothetical protein